MEPIQKQKNLAKLARLMTQDKALHEEIYSLLAALSSYDLDGNLICTYQEIANAMGISRQAAWERHQRGYWRRNVMEAE